MTQLQTGENVTTGKGKHATTTFTATTTFQQGDEVVVRALVTDASGAALAGAVVDIEITGPEARLLTSDPSDAQGVAEARWNTQRPNKKGQGGTSPGTYTATVSDVTASGYTFDGTRTSTTFTVQ